MHCDHPGGCTATVSAEHEEPHKALLATYAAAEAQGWQVRRPIGIVRDLCPEHRRQT